MDELTTRNIFALKSGLERALERTTKLDEQMTEVHRQLAQANADIATLRAQVGAALAMAQGGGATTP